jgi:hypothetical protein
MTEIIGLKFHQVTPDGSMLNLTFEGKCGEAISMSMPTYHIDGVIDALNRSKLEAIAKNAPPRTALTFRGLQKWTVASIPGHEYVFVVLDGSSALEVGYAVFPDVAEEIAAALIEQSSIHSRAGQGQLSWRKALYRGSASRQTLYSVCLDTKERQLIAAPEVSTTLPQRA